MLHDLNLNSPGNLIGRAKERMAPGNVQEGLINTIRMAILRGHKLQKEADDFLVALDVQAHAWRDQDNIRVTLRQFKDAGPSLDAILSLHTGTSCEN